MGAKTRCVTELDMPATAEKIGAPSMWPNTVENKIGNCTQSIHTSGHYYRPLAWEQIVAPG